jgi:hypothetical protein
MNSEEIALIKTEETVKKALMETERTLIKSDIALMQTEENRRRQGNLLVYLSLSLFTSMHIVFLNA